MKYYLGALCLLLGVWLVYQALTHRRAVIAARAQAAAESREPRMHQHLEAMRLGLAPLYILSMLFAGIVLSAIWFVVDRERVFSILDIAGFLAVLMAYAFWMTIRLQYSMLGLRSERGD